jgi:hypothetical protein
LVFLTWSMSVNWLLIQLIFSLSKMFMIYNRHGIRKEGFFPILTHVTIISCEIMPDGRIFDHSNEAFVSITEKSFTSWINTGCLSRNTVHYGDRWTVRMLNSKHLQLYQKQCVSHNLDQVIRVQHSWRWTIPNKYSVKSMFWLELKHWWANMRVVYLVLFSRIYESNVDQGQWKHNH